jgi:serine/threonine-protein phosphatase 2A regulatory subunit B'
VLPYIFPVLHVNSQFHWNTTVNNLTLDVLKIFMELDPPLVDQCTKQYNDELAKKVASKKSRKEQWDKLVKADKGAKK